MNATLVFVAGSLLTQVPTFLAQTSAAQAPATGETPDQALLRTLRDKGVLSDAEYQSLSAHADQQKPAAPEPEDEPTLKHKEGGGFTFETADKRFATTLAGYLQVRGTYNDFDRDGPDDDLSFDVRRARLSVEGYVFEQWLKYRIMIDAIGQNAVTSVATSKDTDGNVVSVSSSRDKVAELKDGYLDAAPYEEFGVRVGQYKIPISREELISASRLQFPDRSITTEEFAPGRDFGLDFHGALSGRLFYDLGVYNGNGENRPANPDGTDMAYNARVGVVLAGDDGKYLLEQQGDTKRSEALLAALEAAYLLDTGNDDIGTGELSGLFKWHGLSTEAAYFARAIDPEGGATERDSGYYVQAGFMITAQIEAALRHAAIDLDSGDDETENSIGLSYYFYAHNLKLQLSYSNLESEPDDGSDLETDRWIAQLTARF